ncbi:response regulator transcription factor [Allofournierella sp.]|uniref:response regulator transcription factor n=1 Tax=Allofournierella sp. TaxID=1940256 RepID=UPI003AB41FBE
MRKILIVEDDPLLNRTLGYNLASDGYQITAAYHYKDAVSRLKETEFDVALLDINLQDGSGLDLCEEIRGRGQHTYIIFITANDKESDMLKGYEAGGADYVTKPFSVTVLCRKVAAVFANLELRTPRHDLFDDGFLTIDFSGQRASLAGEPLDFTPKEYRTLFLFVKNPGIILTKRQILEKLWDIDGDFVDEHTLTTIISRIRKKIETDEHKYIKTAYGMGYQWIGGEQA